METPDPGRRLARWILKGIGLAAVSGAIAFVVLFALLRLDHGISTDLPALTGPFVVSRSIYDWTDDYGLDPMAPVAGAKRELATWIWYPAVGSPSTVAEDYLPAALRSAVEHQSGVLITQFFTRDLSKVHAHSVRDAGVSRLQPAYPVVLMRVGASLEVSDYTALAEDLASHGYIVAGIDAPYRTGIVALPDGRVIKQPPQNNPELCAEKSGEEQADCASKFLSAWAADMAFVLDRLAQLNAADPSSRFAGRLDLSRVGVFGHSFGGAQVTQFCAQDARCKAGIDLDGAPFGSVTRMGMRKPFMILLSDHSRESDPEGGEILGNLQSLYDHLPAESRAYLMIRGANHFLFSDAAVLRSHIVMRILRLFGIVRIDGRRQLAITSYCLRTFFDAYLKDVGAARPPKLVSPNYPEIQAVQ